MADRRTEILKLEERVVAKEEDIDGKLTELTRREQGVSDREVHTKQLQEELKEARDGELVELERISGMTVNEAKTHLLERSEELIRHELARRVRQAEEEARVEAKRRARNLVADALQRVAANHASETTVSLIELPSDDMKGRIIGREGRNIRALEHLTGVDVIIDDTPQAVVLSSFDGIRREVAKLTLTKLIEDGRIHPARIEEMYYQSKAEIEEHVRQAGEQAVFEANCGDFHEELVKILGRLRFRTSYGQNVLKHTLEVVHLAGIMAAELEASVKTARRAALLHDLGKALTHEVEGTHALLSAQYARRYGESAAVVHAIEAHHYEVEPQTVEAVLADRRRCHLGLAARRARREPRALHQAARGPGGGRRATQRRREGLRAPGRPRDPRHRQAEGGRRRRGGAALARDRARDRGPARVPGSDQGDGDPRVSSDRVREVARRGWSKPASARRSAVLGGTPQTPTGGEVFELVWLAITLTGVPEPSAVIVGTARDGRQVRRRGADDSGHAGPVVRLISPVSVQSWPNGSGCGLRSAQAGTRPPAGRRRRLQPKAGVSSTDALQLPSQSFEPMRRYHVTTFGCQMNAHDSERIKGMLEELGLGEAPEQQEADVLVFNTCTIREKPDQRFAAHLAQARALKERDPGKVIAVGGCYAEAQRERLFTLYPYVDVAFGPGSIRTSASGSVPAARAWSAARSASPRSGRSPDGCRCTASAASRPGCRSRWAATRSARTASSRRCAAARSRAVPARSSPRSKAWRAKGCAS